VETKEGYTGICVRRCSADMDRKRSTAVQSGELPVPLSRQRAEGMLVLRSYFYRLAFFFE